jgi:hypothetical protein
VFDISCPPCEPPNLESPTLQSTSNVPSDIFAECGLPEASGGCGGQYAEASPRTHEEWLPTAFALVFADSYQQLSQNRAPSAVCLSAEAVGPFGGAYDLETHKTPDCCPVGAARKALGIIPDSLMGPS